MRVTKELAREICRESGIAWDEDACEPTLQGEPISDIDMEELFHFFSRRRG